jgi:hypothetical protein
VKNPQAQTLVLRFPNTVTNRPRWRLLRYAGNDNFRACHCEEQSDETISTAEKIRNRIYAAAYLVPRMAAA